MRSGLIAVKLGMSPYLRDSDSKICGVTFLQVRDCFVVDIKTLHKDGYDAVVIGSNLPSRKSKKTKPIEGFFKSKEVDYKNFLKEFRVLLDGSVNDIYKIGKKFGCDFFSKGQFIDVRSRSIGKGFAGGMKRHNFKGLESTHGVSVSHRSHGSTGGRQDPGKVFKNKKMAGHMGCRFVTKQNLEIIDIDTENNLLILKGSVPGHKGSVVYLTDAIKKH